MRISTVVTALIFMVCPVLNAQETKPKPVFGASANEVVVPVSVIDKKGNDVPGLTAKDFVVTDDGVPQEVVGMSGEGGTGHCDLILAFDVSQSMTSVAASDSTYSTTTVLDLAKAAAKSLINELGPGDRVALVLFHDRTWYVPAADGSAFHTDLTRVRKVIDLIKPVGNTRLYEAVYAVLKGLPEPNPEHPRRTVMVLLTDGEDTTSLIDDERVLEESRTSRAMIYAIELPHQGTGQEEWERAERAHHFLVSLTTITSGTVQVVHRQNEMHGAYNAIARELSMHYQLAYSPAVITEDGKWHHITVSLVDHRKEEWTLRHRLGYFAPQPMKNK